MPVILVSFGILVLAEVAANVVLEPREGPAALVIVVEAQLLAAGAVAGFLAILLSLRSGPAGARVRLAGLVILLVAIVRLGGEWWSPPSTATDGAGATRGSAGLIVMSWNLELGSKAAVDSLAGILDADADLVALQELTPEVSTAIGADTGLATRYPYRILEPRDGTAGLGLLSRLPLVAGSYGTGPLILRAGLLLPDGRTVQVLDVHPYPPGITRFGGFPAGLDTRRRDEDLLAIRDVVRSLPDPGAALLVGDLNTTPFEPGMRALTAGPGAGALADAHEAAGTGPGFTWRPSSAEWLHIGLLRLDHVMTGAWLRPVSVREDCSIAGDHCRLLVGLEAAGG